MGNLLPTLYFSFNKTGRELLDMLLSLSSRLWLLFKMTCSGIKVHFSFSLRSESLSFHFIWMIFNKFGVGVGDTKHLYFSECMCISWAVPTLQWLVVNFYFCWLQHHMSKKAETRLNSFSWKLQICTKIGSFYLHFSCHYCPFFHSRREMGSQVPQH